MTFELSQDCQKALEAAHHMIDQEKQLGHYIQDQPGKLALTLCKNLMSELSRGVHSIVVTGTNGKTTTVRLICSVLAEAGTPFFTNREGANMSGRIATLFAENYDEEKGPLKKWAVLECDEGYLRAVAPEINPDILVITNIYPDQKARFSSEEHVAELLREAMLKTQPAVCVIAADCHFKQMLMNLPGWKYIEFEETGYSGRMQIPGAFNLRNAAAAASCGEILAIPKDIILRGIEAAGPAFGRMESFWHGNHKVMLTLAKNTAGFRVISDFIQTEWEQYSPKSPEKDTWILAMNKNEGDDLDSSWISENTYAAAAGHFRRILITGNCADLLQFCMKREQVEAQYIPAEEITRYTEQAEGPVLITANYTAMMEIRKNYAEEGLIKPFWKD